MSPSVATSAARQKLLHILLYDPPMTLPCTCQTCTCAAVAGAKPPRDSAAAAAHERIYATLLEYVAVTGGLELALSDEVRRLA